MKALTRYHSLQEAPAWKQERAALLHRLCSSIERRVEREMPVRDAIRQVYQRSAIPAVYRAEPSRGVRLSERSLRRHYDDWRECQAPEAFLPGYVHAKCPITNDSALALLERALNSDSLDDAIASLKADWEAGFAIPGLPRRDPGNGKPPMHASSWRRVLSNEAIIELELYFAARKRLSRLIRRQRKQANAN